MRYPYSAVNWTVRGNAPGSELKLVAAVFYPAEFRAIEGQLDRPGLRLPRRGLLVISETLRDKWAELQAVGARGITMALREPAGRNHAIMLREIDATELLGWASDHIQAGWRATDLDSLAELESILPPGAGDEPVN